MIQQTIKCKTHPNRPVCCVQITEKCDYNNRLMCHKCIAEKKQCLEDVMDLQDFLESPFNMFSIPNRQLGVFDELEKFFDISNRDPETVIEEYRKWINEQIDQFKQNLSGKIEEFRNFQTMVKKAKKLFCEAISNPFSIEKIYQIQKIENYYVTKEWIELEQSLSDYIMQFIKQDNQELLSTLITLKQNELLNNYCFKEFNDFKIKNQKLLKELENQLWFQRTDIKFDSKLLDQMFFKQLNQRILTDFNLKYKLLFRGTEHGMNANAFWNKCNNQGPTLLICKSANGKIFGGYSPCKWINNDKYQEDPSKTSFLFNQNRQEFYPLVNDQYAIYGSTSYGPSFGSGHDLQIGQDFNSGASSLGYSYQVKNQNYQFNKKTHLMGSEKPDLVEMEVYLIQNILK